MTSDDSIKISGISWYVRLRAICWLKLRRLRVFLFRLPVCRDCGFFRPNGGGPQGHCALNPLLYAFLYTIYELDDCDKLHRKVAYNGLLVVRDEREQ